MTRRSGDPTTIDAEVGHVRSLGIDALRARWRTMFETMPPTGLSKDILARMIAHRLQERALGALDREAVKLLDRLGRGSRRLSSAGTSTPAPFWSGNTRASAIPSPSCRMALSGRAPPMRACR